MIVKNNIKIFLILFYALNMKHTLVVQVWDSVIMMCNHFMLTEHCKYGRFLASWQDYVQPALYTVVNEYFKHPGLWIYSFI